MKYNYIAMNHRLILPKLFGKSRRILVLEILLQNHLAKTETGKIQWTHIAEIAKRGNISTSTAKRIVDELREEGWIETKPDTYETPVKNPIKKIRLNDSNSAITELIFFYRKIRGFL